MKRELLIIKTARRSCVLGAALVWCCATAQEPDRETAGASRPATASLPAPSSRQGATSRPAPKDAAQVVNEMYSAVVEARSFSFHVRMTVSSGGELTQLGDADVWIRIGLDPFGEDTIERLNGVLAAPARVRFKAGRVGDAFRALDLDARTVEEQPYREDPDVELSDVEIRLYYVRQLVPPLLQSLSLAASGHYMSMWRLADTEIVDGVLCDVVEYQSPIGTRYVVGRNDRLPRRIDYWQTAFVRVPVQTTYEISKIVIGPPADDAAFAERIPDGFVRGAFGVGKLKTSAIGVESKVPSLTPDVGDVAPDLVVKDLNGFPFVLSKQERRVVVVWFAPDARPQDLVLGEEVLAELHRRLGDRAAVIELLRPSYAQDVVEMRKRDVPFVRSTEGRAVSDAWFVGDFPAFFVVGTDGRILPMPPVRTPPRNLVEEIEASVKRHFEALTPIKKG